VREAILAAGFTEWSGPRIGKPTPRFPVGARVRTKCRDAVWDSNAYKKGSEGTVANPPDGGAGYVAVRFLNGRLEFVSADQLELVPAEPKQKFYEGDCVKWRDHATSTLFLVASIREHCWVTVRRSDGTTEADEFHPGCFDLAYPGPNHPKDCRD